ncbi:hypothetical protein PAXRUDRAFT_824405 [Paxillus rubicundulus Ve08.2h10]|uniref:Unplaced genomic scaffold scaffold_90, whole genome shotgun sequence n=1 Tax=Paxillus rubicundulus Ve08.2h10 TaxID=930991 RepID=A0A0D0DUI3_9AGAM|nr:hypothetical protein PAXRUDRAFT_824405 [Paxillus rubicundulus Ve08.2h10]
MLYIKAWFAFFSNTALPKQIIQDLNIAISSQLLDIHRQTGDLSCFVDRNLQAGVWLAKLMQETFELCPTMVNQDRLDVPRKCRLTMRKVFISLIRGNVDGDGFFGLQAHSAAEDCSTPRLLSSTPCNGITVADVALTKVERFSSVGCAIVNAMSKLS